MKVLLIDNRVSNPEQLVKCSNTETKTYITNGTFPDLNGLLDVNEIERIGYICHGSDFSSDDKECFDSLVDNNITVDLFGCKLGLRKDLERFNTSKLNVGKDNWYVGNDDMRDIYFNGKIEEYIGEFSDNNYYRIFNDGYLNKKGKINNGVAEGISGKVVTMGNTTKGGDVTAGVNGGDVASNVFKIASTKQGEAFAALRTDGSVVTWGVANHGGDHTSGLGAVNGGDIASNVVDIIRGHNSFCALKNDGSCVTWGLASQGGDHTDVTNGLQTGDVASNVVKVIGEHTMFIALKSDGTIVDWGASSSQTETRPINGGSATNINKMYDMRGKANYLFIKDDGSCLTLGTDHTDETNGVKGGDIASNVEQISATRGAFAVIRENGSVVTWGSANSGGDHTDGTYGVKGGDVASNVLRLYSGFDSFCALRNDGSCVTWGNTTNGGDHTNNTFPASSVTGGDIASNVVHVFMTRSAACALRSDGSVVSWGYGGQGGDHNDASYGVKGGDIASNVKNVYFSEYAFCALKNNGSVVTWGLDSYGGDHTNGYYGIQSGQGDAASNISIIHPGLYGFMGIKNNNDIVFWGNPHYGYIPSDGTYGVKGGDVASNVLGMAVSTNAVACIVGSEQVSINQYSLESQIEMLKDPIKRASVSETTLTFQGDTSINPNMIAANQYRMFNIPSDGVIDTSEFTGDDNGFYIPNQDGEEFTMYNRTFTSNGSTVYEKINGTLTPITQFTVDAITFNVFAGSTGGNGSGGALGGDPHIYPLIGQRYDLPNVEETFLLLEKNDLIVHGKCSFLNPKMKDTILNKYKKKDINEYYSLKRFYEKSTFFEKLIIKHNKNTCIIDCFTLEYNNNINDLQVNKEYKYHSLENLQNKFGKRKVKLLNTLTLEIDKVKLTVTVDIEKPSTLNTVGVNIMEDFKDYKGALIREEDAIVVQK